MKTRKTASVRRKLKASTVDILGEARPARGAVPAKWRVHYRRLTELRDHFVQQQRELTRDANEEKPSFSTHQADAGTDAYDRDLALGVLSSDQDALYQIEQALSRIRQGTYGTCELTGRPIEPGRLEAVPWARFSIDAERQFEREGKRKRAGLGRRETVGRTDTRSLVAAEEADEA